MNRTKQLAIGAHQQRRAAALGDLVDFPRQRRCKVLTLLADKCQQRIHRAFAVHAALVVNAGQAGFSAERHGGQLVLGRLGLRVQGAQVFNDGFAFRRVVRQGREQRAFGHLAAADAGRRDHRRTPAITKGDGAGLVQQQHMYVPGCFHSTAGLGDHIEAYQAVHAGNADGRQQAANGRGNQRHKQCDQKHQRQAAIGEVGERLQRYDHQQEDQRQADQ